MYIKINENTFNLFAVPAIGQDEISFDIITDDTTEELQGKLTNIDVIEQYDNNGLLDTYKGYSNILYIRKNVSAGTYTICFSRPSITIKGLSNSDEIIAILRQAGYEVE